MLLQSVAFPLRLFILHKKRMILAGHPALPVPHSHSDNPQQTILWASSSSRFQGLRRTGLYKPCGNSGGWIAACQGFFLMRGLIEDRPKGFGELAGFVLALKLSIFQ